MTRLPADLLIVEELLGRPLAGRCAVVVRRLDGRRWSLRTSRTFVTAPRCRPCTGWLTRMRDEAVSRLESDGGVHRFEELVDARATPARP
jgi:hypothetical protein